MEGIKKRFHYYRFFFNTRTLRKNFHFYKINSIRETIEEIIEHKKSISRFGDGEFRLVLDDSGINFQSGSIEMTRRLREVIQSDLSNHIVALPETFAFRNGLNWRVKYWWLNFINHIGVKIAPFLNPQRNYGNSFMSRFYLDYENTNHVLKTVKLLQKMWANKEVLIVEGEFSRLGVGNDLFDGAQSLQRILCPAKGAFAHYDEILSTTKKLGKDKLILIALGPTATVMAYDLAKENYWAVDIGHVDLEYMWFLMGVKEKSPVVGRLVNETNEKQSLEIPQEFRQQYLNSIIATI